MSGDSSADRVGLLSHAVSCDQLKPGDHIYVYRDWLLYAHHGIYLGENKVVHFTGPKKKSSVRISRDTLKEFSEGAQVRLVAYGISSAMVDWSRRGTCHKEDSDRVEIVLRRAKHYLEHPDDWPAYHVIKNNCEHFAFFCKTGKFENPEGQAGNAIAQTIADIVD